MQCSSSMKFFILESSLIDCLIFFSNIPQKLSIAFVALFKSPFIDVAFTFFPSLAFKIVLAKLPLVLNIVVIQNAWPMGFKLFYFPLIKIPVFLDKADISNRPPIDGVAFNQAVVWSVVFSLPPWFSVLQLFEWLHAIILCISIHCSAFLAIFSAILWLYHFSLVLNNLIGSVDRF